MIRSGKLLITLIAVTVAVPLSSAAAESVAADPPGPTVGFASSGVAAAAAAAPIVVASGLTIPWGLTGLPDGSAVVTERDSTRILQIKPGVAPKVVYTVTEARPSGEGGLLGIARSPDFARTKMLFIYYSTATDNRVAKIVLGSSARPVPIVTGIPRGSIHNGGALAFSPNGILYIGTGDTGNRALAQNTNSLGGKVLRVDPRNGANIPGNRWNKILSIGHRNVQGLVFSPVDHLLWATELGQDTQDEVNLLVIGGNYGWPTCEGKCGRPGLRDPALTWQPAESSPSAISAVTTSSGVVFYVGALRGQRLWRLTISGTRVTSSAPRLVGTYGRIRGVGGRGDRSLWITTSNGGGTDKVIRLPAGP